MNRVHRLTVLGNRANLRLNEQWWLFAYCCSKMSELGLKDEQIAEQYSSEEAMSHDSVLNARRAYTLYCQLRSVAPKPIRALRKHMAKSKWEITARYHPDGGPEALEDLLSGREMPVRDFEKTMREKYRGEDRSLRQDVRVLESHIKRFVQDFMAYADKHRNTIRLARSVRAASEAMLEQLQSARDALRKDAK